MTDKELAGLLVREAVDAVVSHFQLMLRGNDAVDPTWRSLQLLSRELPDEHRERLVLLARQAAVDAVSTVLAIIDGCAVIPEVNQPLSLRCGEGNERLDGSLQDYFLELTERSRP